MRTGGAVVPATVRACCAGGGVFDAGATTCASVSALATAVCVGAWTLGGDGSTVVRNVWNVVVLAAPASGVAVATTGWGATIG